MKIPIFIIFDEKSTFDNFQKQIENFNNLNELMKKHFEIFAIDKTNNPNKKLIECNIEVYNTDDIIYIINSKWSIILNSECVLSRMGYINLLKKIICTSDLEKNKIYKFIHKKNNKCYNNSFLIKTIQYKNKSNKSLSIEYLTVY